MGLAEPKWQAGRGSGQLPFDILNPNHPVLAALTKDERCAIERRSALRRRLLIGSGGHRVGDQTTEPVTETVSCRPLLQVGGQLSDQAEVRLAAGLQGEEERGEEERGEEEDCRQGGEEGEAVGGGTKTMLNDSSSMIMAKIPQGGTRKQLRKAPIIF